MTQLSGIKSVSYDDVENRTFEIIIKDSKTGEFITDTISMDTFKKTAYWMMGFMYIVCNIEKLIKNQKT